MQDELDKDLQSLFREQNLNLPEEPFLSNMLKLIQRERSRRFFRQRVILVLGLACCVWLSPFFVHASALLSAALKGIFGIVEIYMDTRTGVFTAALCALLLWFFRRSLRFT